MTHNWKYELGSTHLPEDECGHPAEFRDIMHAYRDHICGNWYTAPRTPDASLAYWYTLGCFANFNLLMSELMPR